MDLTHDFTVPIDVPAAWQAFNDLERIAPCFPGATLTSVDGDDFTGTAKVRLGPVSLQYSGTGRFVERDESARRAVITVSGKDKRGNGTASATITAHLEKAAGSGTRVVVATDLKVTGRPAQFGRGMISDVGGKILDQFADCLAVTLGQRSTTADASTAVPHASPPEPAPPEPAPPGRPATPAPAPLAPVPSAPHLDLGAVVLPALVRRYGPALLACGLTAAVTWRIARR